MTVLRNCEVYSPITLIFLNTQKFTYTYSKTENLNPGIFSFMYLGYCYMNLVLKGIKNVLQISRLLCFSNELYQTHGETSTLECFTNAPLMLTSLDTPRMKWRLNVMNLHSASLTEKWIVVNNYKTGIALEQQVSEQCAEKLWLLSTDMSN